MKKALILASAALLVPSVALAAPPADKGKAAPNVQYILQGKLLVYNPYKAGSEGSITIVITSTNYRAEALTGQALTFPIDANTKMTPGKLTTINDLDNGTLKVSGPKDLPSLELDTVLQATPVSQVIDEGQ